MGKRGIEIGGEVARVRRELVSFRDEFLPATVDPGSPPGRPDEHARPLHRWREAADRLLDALPDPPTGGGRGSPDRGDYQGFLFQPVTASSYTIREGRISWRIELFVGWDWAAGAVLAELTGPGPTAPDIMDELRLCLPEARRRILALQVDESYLWNLLCVALVPIADLDPAFARLALDGATWRAIVLGDREIDEGTRGRRLAAVDGSFRRVLNNALLHVIGALANNHFEEIGDLLDHPDLIGGYTTLMPHYAFAVLFEKVVVLHEMVREAGDR